ncbi:MAG TPA: DUF58 domain-containing protein [Thermoanaerobaculia bacterium]|nr:DUF58 domain-containing protein [Thermoanaerobaculia bacterium]
MPEGIRITTVGLWYVLLSIVVAIAATNTGNNSLYMVMAVVLAVLILSGILSRENVRGLEIELQPPGEVFANRPFSVGFTLKSRSRLFPRWFLLFTVSRSAQPMLVPFLPKQGRSVGHLEMMIQKRGHHRFPHAHVSSLFPFGFFRKGVRYPVDLDLLVFPEVFEAGAMNRPEAVHQMGEDASRRAGWGHGLHSLRQFRQGDDPRSIHWKQTARTGSLVYMERESEQSRRLAILFDNGVGELADDDARGRFERLVSETATAALDHLARGYEVELVTRDRILAFAGGARQRLAILEALALVEAQPPTPEPLASSDRRAQQLRVHLEPDPPSRSSSTVLRMSR